MISDVLYEQTGKLRDEINELHSRQELSQKQKDYFEPGKMQYQEQYDGIYRDDNTFMMKFPVMGTQYEGRIDEIEFIKKKQAVFIERDPENHFNSNNFRILDYEKNSIGNMPASLCNALAKLYDAGNLKIESSKVSFCEPLSKRNRHARKPIVFVEVEASVVDSLCQQ